MLVRLMLALLLAGMPGASSDAPPTPVEDPGPELTEEQIRIYGGTYLMQPLEAHVRIFAADARLVTVEEGEEHLPPRALAYIDDHRFLQRGFIVTFEVVEGRATGFVAEDENRTITGHRVD